MYDLMLTLHSWLRWVVFLGGLMVIIIAVKGLQSGAAPAPSDVKRVRINAVLFDAQSPAGLAEALRLVVGNADLRQRLAAGASKTIQERQLSWLDCATRVTSVCEGLVAGAGTKAGYQCRSAG